MPNYLPKNFRYTNLMKAQMKDLLQFLKEENEKDIQNELKSGQIAPRTEVKANQRKLNP